MVIGVPEKEGRWEEVVQYAPNFARRIDRGSDRRHDQLCGDQDAFSSEACLENRWKDRSVNPGSDSETKRRNGPFARQGGREYLVTSEGLRTVIRGERMREMFTNKLLELIAKHLDEAETAESLILRFVRRERYEQWIRTSEDWTRENFFSFLHKLWERGEWRLKPIGQWTHQFAFREQLPEKWASWLIEMAEEELRSARGEAFVQDIVTHFLERGGWLGILAELMTDTQKLSLRLRAMLLELLKSPNTKSR